MVQLYLHQFMQFARKTKIIRMPLFFFHSRIALCITEEDDHFSNARGFQRSKRTQKKEGATRNDLRNILDTDSQLRRYIDSFAVKEGLLREEHRTYGNNIVPLYFKTDHAKRMYHFFFFSFSFLAGLSSIVSARAVTHVASTQVYSS